MFAELFSLRFILCHFGICDNSSTASYRLIFVCYFSGSKKLLRKPNQKTGQLATSPLGLGLLPSGSSTLECLKRTTLTVLCFERLTIASFEMNLASKVRRVNYSHRQDWSVRFVPRTVFILLGLRWVLLVEAGVVYVC